MTKKLLKITEIATLPKSSYFPDTQRYQSQMLIAQIEDLNKDCSHFHIFYTQRKIVVKQCYGEVLSGRAGSSFQMIQLEPKWSYNIFERL